MLAAAGPAAQAGRGVRLGADTLSRLLDDLCKPGALERRREGERQLCEYVEAEARDLSADAFSKFMTEAYARLGAMVKSPDAYKRLGAVLAIDELIGMRAIGDDAARTAAFSSMLRRLFEDSQDLVLLEVGATTLGHLVRSGGPMMADVVERQVRDALPWLNPRLEPSEARRYAAVLILRELADCAPAVFNVHVKSFIDGVWGGLRDPKLHVREASVQALTSVLVLVEKRETRYRYGTIADCYTEMGDFEAAAANYDKYIRIMSTDGTPV
ncbi:target of growth-regulatory PI3K kinase [Raphidocelis subcapitata]|uniref:Target of growth-regulatory PI3K kinase n=1 Tax=Raphidocelis subcapitata TaxID=307507 RepID=A0A2V0P6C6_9CHLO|nr:target of growth-regulatory PI3K kinase [Raphidocelis subcapitata]|eukprot:GBF92737.1 target of growth-regulatory PI3K kinase [Raphidocelis subcapitata]